jgi:glycerophosphoryl diester phosphodiesterase
MIVIAHRGASGYAPEHTFASWDRAVEIGADYLEQDLQMTRDGVLIVMHDETLDRTARRDGAPVTGRVIDRDWAELADLDVGSWFDPRFADQRIPTLDAVLKRYPDHNFYIETKKPEDAPGMEEALLGLLHEHGLIEPSRAYWRVLIQSFSEASLRKMHAAEPDVPMIQLLHRGFDAPGGPEAYMKEIATYAVGIGPHWSDVTPDLMRAVAAACLHVHPYTIDDPAEMRRLTDLGVHGMFSNYPDRLLALRPADEPRGAANLRIASQEIRDCRAGKAQT